MFFFFQGEDGIRGGLVTGVQTCALPICRAYPTTIGDILQRVRSIRNLMLGGSEQLQKELTFWGYLNAPEYLSQEERRRRGLMMPQQSGIATPTVQPMPGPEQMAPGYTVPQELPAQQLQPVAP